MNDVFVLDAVRLPVGRYGGGYAGVRPDDLAAAVVGQAVGRVRGLDPATIDDVWMGDANGAGEDNRDVARMAVLLAGLPTSVPGATVNRLCGSGMEAVASASRAIAMGDASVCVAGGVESMTRAPWVLLKPGAGHPRGDEVLHSTTLGWRMVNPAMPTAWTASLGQGAERLADEYGIGREEQDAFALESHRKAARAWEEGRFAAEVVRAPQAALPQDETVRANTTAEALAGLPPAFRPDGTVTAGNSSPFSDGASALVLASERAAAALGAEPLARVVSRAVTALDPRDYGLGPVEASALALERAGIGWGDLSLVELNEAFAAQALACLAHWKDLDPPLS
ncbi:MAG TPA: thiolase family protein [Acidimicrobiales bacterium]|nr:thiolase family protein [Acidimicrobiales bacterium]